ncbi:uncharacterized protein [Euphorbia lathyris]|uniref:uncharacterized protein isoform X2 n=1 Tax=Euphorbia lathyris TaxID=212925 RepID=UPI003313B08F
MRQSRSRINQTEPIIQPVTEDPDDEMSVHQESGDLPPPPPLPHRRRGRPRRQINQGVAQVEPQVNQVGGQEGQASRQVPPQFPTDFNFNQFLSGVEMMQQILIRQGQGSSGSSGLGAVERFARMMPTMYDGVSGDAMDYLDEVEKNARFLKGNDYETIQMAEYSLKGDAGVWFKDNIFPQMQSMTWAEFKELFKQAFIPFSYTEEQRRKFATFRKDNNMSVAEFTRQFLRLGRYVPEVMANERIKCSTYISGLGEPYTSMHIMSVTSGCTFQQLVDAARHMELDFNQSRATRHSIQSPKPKDGGQSSLVTGGNMGSFQMGSTQPFRQRSRFHKKGRHGQRHGRGFNQSGSGQSSGSSHNSSGSGYSSCNVCGRNHQGPCYTAPGSCFRCGQYGHMARQCPQSGFQPTFSQGSSSNAVRPNVPVQAGNLSTPSQFQNAPGIHQGQSSRFAGRGRTGGRNPQSGQGQARAFNLTPQEAHTSNDVISGGRFTYGYARF